MESYTKDDKTTFYYKISNDHFPISLLKVKKHIQNPDFSNFTQIEKEIYAIDREYKKNLQSNIWKQYQILRSLSNEKSPYHNFNVGNKDSFFNPILNYTEHKKIINLSDINKTFSFDSQYFDHIYNDESENYYFKDINKKIKDDWNHIKDENSKMNNKTKINRSDNNLIEFKFNAEDELNIFKNLNFSYLRLAKERAKSNKYRKINNFNFMIKINQVRNKTKINKNESSINTTELSDKSNHIKIRNKTSLNLIFSNETNKNKISSISSIKKTNENNNNRTKKFKDYIILNITEPDKEKNKTKNINENFNSTSSNEIYIQDYYNLSPINKTIKNKENSIYGLFSGQVNDIHKELNTKFNVNNKQNKLNDSNKLEKEFSQIEIKLNKTIIKGVIFHNLTLSKIKIIRNQIKNKTEEKDMNINIDGFTEHEGNKFSKFDSQVNENSKIIKLNLKQSKIYNNISEKIKANTINNFTNHKINIFKNETLKNKTNKMKAKIIINITEHEMNGNHKINKNIKDHENNNNVVKLNKNDTKNKTNNFSSSNKIKVNKESNLVNKQIENTGNQTQKNNSKKIKDFIKINFTSNFEMIYNHNHSNIDNYIKKKDIKNSNNSLNHMENYPTKSSNVSNKEIYDKIQVNSNKHNKENYYQENKKINLTNLEIEPYINKKNLNRTNNLKNIISLNISNFEILKNNTQKNNITKNYKDKINFNNSLQGNILNTVKIYINNNSLKENKFVNNSNIELKFNVNKTDKNKTHSMKHFLKFNITNHEINITNKNEIKKFKDNLFINSSNLEINNILKNKNKEKFGFKDLKNKTNQDIKIESNKTKSSKNKKIEGINKTDSLLKITYNNTIKVDINKIKNFSKKNNSIKNESGENQNYFNIKSYSIFKNSSIFNNESKLKENILNRTKKFIEKDKENFTNELLFQNIKNYSYFKPHNISESIIKKFENFSQIEIKNNTNEVKFNYSPNINKYELDNLTNKENWTKIENIKLINKTKIKRNIKSNNTKFQLSPNNEFNKSLINFNQHLISSNNSKSIKQIEMEIQKKFSLLSNKLENFFLKNYKVNEIVIIAKSNLPLDDLSSLVNDAFNDLNWEKTQERNNNLNSGDDSFLSNNNNFYLNSKNYSNISNIDKNFDNNFYWPNEISNSENTGKFNNKSLYDMKYISYINDEDLNYILNQHLIPPFNINYLGDLIIYNKYKNKGPASLDILFPINTDNLINNKPNEVLSYLLKYQIRNSLVDRLKNEKIIDNFNIDMLKVNKRMSLYLISIDLLNDDERYIPIIMNYLFQYLETIRFCFTNDQKLAEIIMDDAKKLLKIKFELFDFSEEFETIEQIFSKLYDNFSNYKKSEILFGEYNATDLDVNSILNFMDYIQPNNTIVMFGTSRKFNDILHLKNLFSKETIELRHEIFYNSTYILGKLNDAISSIKNIFNSNNNYYNNNIDKSKVRVYDDFSDYVIEENNNDFLSKKVKNRINLRNKQNNNTIKYYSINKEDTNLYEFSIFDVFKCSNLRKKNKYITKILDYDRYDKLNNKTLILSDLNNTNNKFGKKTEFI